MRALGSQVIDSGLSTTGSGASSELDRLRTRMLLTFDP
jgi:hypothetical protein